MKSLTAKQNIRKYVIWAILSVGIAAGSIYAVKQVSDEFSFSHLVELIRNAAPVPVALAFVAMGCFILCESMSIRTLLKSFGHKCTVRQGIVYTTADLYVSAITPSASGGQPASWYFMVKDGFPASGVTVVLVYNVAMYTLAVIIIGLSTIIFVPYVFNYFGPAAKALIISGAVVLALLASLTLVAVIKKSAIDSLGRFAIKLGKKFKLIRNKSTEVGILQWIDDYKGYCDQLGGHWGALAKSLGFNLLQRLCQLSVPMFMYIAINYGEMPLTTLIAKGSSLLFAQSLISIGSTLVPIPGAMAYTDLMMLNAYGKIMSESEAASLEIMARSVSFYFTIIFSFFVTAIAFILLSRKTKKNPELHQ